jgi:hypothetical protein
MTFYSKPGAVSAISRKSGKQQCEVTMADKRVYEAVRHTYTSDELRELGTQLAREQQVIMDLETGKAQSTAAFNAQIKEAENRRNGLTIKINNGYEMRETEIMVLLETPRPGMKRLLRVDTGEILRDEPMTLTEMQQSFGFREEPPEAPAVEGAE